MSVNDPLGDMLTRIRNALGRGKSKVSTPASTLRVRVLDVLKAEGYIVPRPGSGICLAALATSTAPPSLTGCCLCFEHD